MEYLDNSIIFEKDLYYDMVATHVANEKHNKTSQGDGGYNAMSQESKLRSVK